jgi:hypothetical protein
MALCASSQIHPTTADPVTTRYRYMAAVRLVIAATIGPAQVGSIDFAP